MIALLFSATIIASPLSGADEYRAGKDPQLDAAIAILTGKKVVSQPVKTGTGVHR